MRREDKTSREVNVGSMADIAFLLLIFFLVSTTLLQEKGLSLKLPPKLEHEIDVPMKERNIFKILINSNDQIMVNEMVRTDLSGLAEEIQAFVLNPTSSKSLSESPKKAIVSLKTNRGTQYAQFIAVLDEVKGAYYGIYADRVNLTSEEFRALKKSNPEDFELYQRGKSGIPMNISIAEPTL